MKKLIAMLLALCMVLGLVACGGAPAETPTNPVDTPVVNDPVENEPV